MKVKSQLSPSNFTPWNKKALDTPIPARQHVISVEEGVRAVEAAAKGISQMKEHEAQDRIFNIMNSLPKNVANKVVRKFKRQVKEENREERIKRKKAALEFENDGIQAKVVKVSLFDKKHPLWEEVARWGTDDFVLQKCSVSKLHKLEEAVSTGFLLAPKARFTIINTDNIPGHVFVVEHDWAKAFEKSENIESGEFKLPYEYVGFEFAVSGRHVCAFIDEENYLQVFAQFGDYWIDLTSPDFVALFKKLHDLLLKQIRTICIVLDAEVATTDIIRAPHKLNHQREKVGRLPLYDYHVVKLANRKKYTPLPADHVPEETRHRRFHFVRGHWKHYANHKTWTKWYMRGDPDLGFVDKEYRL